jgi:hypothetical protein
MLRIFNRKLFEFYRSCYTTVMWTKHGEVAYQVAAVRLPQEIF